MMWQIEGPGGGRFGKHCRCWPVAAKLAVTQGREVFVRYHGAKRPGNRDIQRSDFVVRPNGDIDYSIDPTWWEHK